ncbi:hypothetical protein [Caulobacter sp. S45]|uniref:hypothetical protein n=1 Tax=Caulobacter sp. S45 TaxID=1641861 RepID=UPI001575BA64|nr:hypothetical protein [Caulobacter sp. S45]
MDLGSLFFFTFLGAVIIVPQVLRYMERGRLHDTLRAAYERGQTVPPEVIAALSPRRRVYASDYAPLPPEIVAGWQPRPDPGSGVAPEASVTPVMSMSPVFVSQSRRDLRRGLIWLAVGLGLVAAGVASYAGLYNIGGAQETLSLFASFGAIPAFIGLTYLALAWFSRGKTKA